MKIFDFARLEELRVRLAATSATTEKQKILAEFPDLKEILLWIYDPYRKFYVTLEAVKNYIDNGSGIPMLTTAQAANPEKTVVDLLRELSTRKISGHSALGRVAATLLCFSRYFETITCIIDKDLGVGVSGTIINKVWPDLIPEFRVALGEAYENPGDIDWNSKYLISRKLDGCRCLAFVDENGVRTISRQGLEFNTLGALEESIHANTAWWGMNSMVLDGEICIVDDGGNEDFQAVIKVIRKKNHTIALKNLRFYVFDILTREEFDSRTSTLTLSERLSSRGETFRSIPGVEILKQELLTLESFDRLQAEVESQGWEGLILRKDVPYKGKRSKDILKVKVFHDTEVLVIATENGELNVVDGGSRKEMMMARVVCDYEGNCLDVGGGFTLAERRRFFLHPEEIVGKLITVKYFERTTNQDGGNSLRFPVFKGIVPSKNGERTI